MSLYISKISFSNFYLMKSVGNGAIDHHMFAGRDQDNFNCHLGLVGMWGTHICETTPKKKPGSHLWSLLKNPKFQANMEKPQG